MQNCLGAMHEVVLGARGSILKIIPASAWSPLKMQRQQDIFCIKFSYHQAVSTALSHTHTLCQNDEILNACDSLPPALDFLWGTQTKYCFMVHRPYAMYSYSYLFFSHALRWCLSSLLHVHIKNFANVLSCPSFPCLLLVKSDKRVIYWKKYINVKTIYEAKTESVLF